MPDQSMFRSTAATEEMWFSDLPQLKKYGHFQTPYSKQYDVSYALWFISSISLIAWFVMFIS